MAIVLEQQKQVERLESLLDEVQRRGEAYQPRKEDCI
jgi:hypothetical protein